MSSPRSDKVRLSLNLPITLKEELQFEAWQQQLSVSTYIVGLLSNRGKLARGGYVLLKPK